MPHNLPSSPSPPNPNPSSSPSQNPPDRLDARQRIQNEVQRQIAEQIASGMAELVPIPNESGSVPTPDPSSQIPPTAPLPPPPPPETEEEKKQKTEVVKSALEKLNLETVRLDYPGVRGFLVHFEHIYKEHEFLVWDANVVPRENGGADPFAIVLVRHKKTGKRHLAAITMFSCNDKETELFIEFVDKAHARLKRGGKKFLTRMCVGEEDGAQ